MLSIDPARPARSLVSAFVLWKTLLLLVAFGSGLGPAYDTSTTLTGSALRSSRESPYDLAAKLTRWDAIYFMQAARRGYTFEQEWAFGLGLPTVVSFLVKVLTSIGFTNNGNLESNIGIGISHISHLLSVLVLHQLCIKLYRQKRLAFIASLLHILSPAGLFLSAPYNEAPFSFLTFTGYLLFAHGCLDEPHRLLGDVAIVGSGILFGIATVFRSNGLLNGAPFAVYAVIELSGAIKNPNAANLRRLASLGIGGQCIALGFIGPQALAYDIFCSATSGNEQRQWCTKLIPSIYTFVQEKYWNVGFLRYWTPGNIPLFLLAAPMLYLLIRSAWQILISTLSSLNKQRSQVAMTDASILIAVMASSQLLLSVLAITNYHVQIITRISSGYPLWYIWLAQRLQRPENSKTAGGVVVYMIMYAIIQGALFASFLPPA